MLDLDREIMNKFYKSSYSDADKVTRVSNFMYTGIWVIDQA